MSSSFYYQQIINNKQEKFFNLGLAVETVHNGELVCIFRSVYKIFLRNLAATFFRSTKAKMR